ncbi:winged helix DNA-binding domain-containing protein [Plantactinospora sp. CA-290183]|uniref:winged helix DNA-binding domain-containing protein n=1 Tax=Plantactinospora sp. CA-290183 TaxID=3240006 RepID=UPI003D8C96D9
MSRDIARRRLRNLRLTGAPLPGVPDVVHRLGAVQSQDYGPAKWSVGERTSGVGDADLDRAFNDGVLLRTHLLRPTWHFVLPADIGWLLDLTAPRVRAQCAYQYRQLGLDLDVRERATRLIADVLQGGNHLTRRELAGPLEREGLRTEDFRLGHLMLHAELEGVICSGPLRGRQHTYALLAERAPDTRRLGADEALAELVLRYFTGHGPATIKDLRWWSSLPVGEINRGLEMAGDRLDREVVDGVTYWSADSGPAPETGEPRAHLLQAYDEYIVGYRDSRDVNDLAGRRRSLPPGTLLPNGVAVFDSQVCGHWRRTVRRGSVLVEVALYEPPDDVRLAALRAAAQRQGEFLGVEARLETSVI